MSRSDAVDSVLANTRPLFYPRGSRLPLFLWPVIDPPVQTDEEAERLLRALDERGIAAISTWNHAQRAESLTRSLRLARIQKRLGLSVNVNANPLLHRFCDGSPETAHVSADGERFFDTTFSSSVRMGCPFALRHRYAEITARVEAFAGAFKEQGIDVDFVFADWEIDGAIEWNGAWEASRRCVRCRERIPDIDDFTRFQAALREIRCDIQRVCYADVLRSRFPRVLVGNYGVYPHDGYRYWYDYFETFVEGAPHRVEGRARYRQWYPEFPLTGYTFAMPVVYTWDPIYAWYDFRNPDYRWFYNMLRVASNAAANTPSDIPLITFVHWHTTWISDARDPDVRQFGESAYQELLWHMLLRGHDAFFLWCPPDQSVDEVRLLHAVYAESLQYRQFLDSGVPVTFHVPPFEGAVVSALRLGDRLLVRRTDFADGTSPVDLEVGGRRIPVPAARGRCQVLSLNP